MKAKESWKDARRLESGRQEMENWAEQENKKSYNSPPVSVKASSDLFLTQDMQLRGLMIFESSTFSIGSKKKTQDM